MFGVFGKRADLLAVKSLLLFILLVVNIDGKEIKNLICFLYQTWFCSRAYCIIEYLKS